MQRVLTKPFLWYNDVLIKYPLLTKCVTSGVMYASGDVIAQYTENYTKKRLLQEKAPTTPDDAAHNNQNEEFKLNKSRVAIFFIFGTLISGPSYHYWFNYLNELPALMWRYKQMKHRGKILRSYAFLKAHGIEVKLDPSKLPTAAPLDKWKGKAAKIIADQLIFSSIYTLVFFVCVGMMEGIFEKLQISAGKETSSSSAPITSLNDARVIAMVEKLKKQLKHQSSFSSYAEDDDHPNTSDSHHQEKLTVGGKEHEVTPEVHVELQKQEMRLIQDIVELVRELDHTSSSSSPSQSNPSHHHSEDKSEFILSEPSWQTIWNRTWAHTKDVYVQTYLTDCIVWPPLQLINFTFVPLRFQFLFVNFANLGWNTFLSLMANKKGDEIGSGNDSHH